MKKRAFFIFFFLIGIAFGQEISFRLDSIHKLPGSNYEKLDLYYPILDDHQKNADYTQLGSDAHQLAKWIHKEKYIDESIKIVSIAYKAREKAIPHNPDLLKRSYFNYAIYHSRNNNCDEAIEFFKKVIDLDGTSNLFKGRSASIIGDCYRKKNDLFQSEKYHKKAIQLLHPDTKLKYTIYNYINLAETYRHLRNSNSAEKGISYLLIADSILKKNKQHYTNSSYNVQLSLGNFYYEGVGVQDEEKAIKHYKNALLIAKKLENNLYQSTIYYNIGVIKALSGSLEAKKYFDKAEEKAIKGNKSLAFIYLGRGIEANYNKEYIKAQHHFTDAFSAHFGKKVNDIYWLPKKKDLSKIENKTIFLELLKRRLFGWNHVAIQENKASFSKQAIKTAKTADELIDIIIKENFSYRSKLFWRDLAAEIYVMGLKACFHLKKYDEAFYFIEKNKALLLTKEISKSIDYNNQQDLISKIIDLKNLKLQENQAVLNYIMAERVANAIPEAYLMILTKDNTSLVELQNIPNLLQNIRSLRQKLNTPFKTSKDIETYRKDAFELYNLLVPKNFQNDLKNKKVTIIPDHFLSTIPFEALVTDINSGKYLIEDCEINYTYSLSFQKENSLIKRKNDYEFLGIAPINFSNQLTTLKNSEKEVTVGNSFYNGDILLNENATKETFTKTAKNYNILHLATHADASDSIAPWIAFQNTKLIDKELSSVQNTAELVVLSACNTSLGEVRRGEGVLSLARSFFQGGANTVIPSLWSTNDKATATITGDFYKHLSKGKTKSEALRIAKLNYLKNNTDAEASPHYWASLILIGDAGTLLPETNYITILLWFGLGLIIVVLGYLLLVRKRKSTKST